MQKALLNEGAVADLVATRLGPVSAADGSKLVARKSFLTVASVLYDAVYLAGGANSVATLSVTADAVHFLNEAYKHCKPIAADADATQTLAATYFYSRLPEFQTESSRQREGLIVGNSDTLSSSFINAIKQHRFWDREKARKVPA